MRALGSEAVAARCSGGINWRGSTGGGSDEDDDDDVGDDGRWSDGVLRCDLASRLDAAFSCSSITEAAILCRRSRGIPYRRLEGHWM